MEAIAQIGEDEEVVWRKEELRILFAANVQYCTLPVCLIFALSSETHSSRIPHM